MRFPKSLKEGGRVGFIAPSFSCSQSPYKEWFEDFILKLNKSGYKTVLGPNCFEESGVGKSNTPDKCGEEINDFFTKDLSDIIISCGGGETMCEDLTFVDFERIKKSEPKWYMGYSDNTNLTFTLPTICDTAAIYGPNAPALSMEPRHKALKDAWDILTGSNIEDGCITLETYDGWEGPNEGTKEVPRPPYNAYREPVIRAYNNGPVENCSFTGRMIGGCLDLLVVLCGTKYDKVAEFNRKYGNEGIIWFLEACDLTSIAVRRALWQLSEAGWFENASGFIFGRPFLYDNESFGLSMEDAVLTALAKINVPIILDADLGHLPPTMPIISGAFGKADFSNKKLRLKQYIN